MQLVQELVNFWQRVAILDCQVVQGAVVQAESQRTIWFLGENHRRTEGGGGGPYPTFVEVPGELLLYLSELRR